MDWLTASIGVGTPGLSADSVGSGRYWRTTPPPVGMLGVDLFLEPPTTITLYRGCSLGPEGQSRSLPRSTSWPTPRSAIASNCGVIDRSVCRPTDLDEWRDAWWDTWSSTRALNRERSCALRPGVVWRLGDEYGIEIPRSSPSPSVRCDSAWWCDEREVDGMPPPWLGDERAERACIRGFGVSVWARQI